MIHVLVMANESLLADYIASTLAQEIDLDVVRLTRRELGSGGRYSVVILVDEGEAEDEILKLKDFGREEVTLLLIQVSLKSKNIYVLESYQLINPPVDQLIQLVREFSRKNLRTGSKGDRESQKKIHSGRTTNTKLQTGEPVDFPVNLFAAQLQTVSVAQCLAIRNTVLAASRKFLHCLTPLHNKTQRTEQCDAVVAKESLQELVYGV